MMAMRRGAPAPSTLEITTAGMIGTVLTETPVRKLRDVPTKICGRTRIEASIAERSCTSWKLCAVSEVDIFSQHQDTYNKLQKSSMQFTTAFARSIIKQTLVKDQLFQM